MYQLARPNIYLQQKKLNRSHEREAGQKRVYSLISYDKHHTSHSTSVGTQAS